MQVITQGIQALIVLIGLSIPIIVIAVIYYIKKRFEHRQIMAAIEKGTPLSELKPARKTGPAWIKSITAGIALLLMSLPFLYIFLGPLIHSGYTEEGRLVPFGILFAIGLAFFIRGLLLRKAQKQLSISDRSKNNPE